MPHYPSGVIEDILPCLPEGFGGCIRESSFITISSIVHTVLITGEAYSGDGNYLDKIVDSEE